VRSIFLGEGHSARGRAQRSGGEPIGPAPLFDDRLGRTFNYSSKAGVIISEILCPMRAGALA